MLGNRSRVLLVEDDAVLRRGLARIFSQDEAKVTQLADGREELTTKSTKFTKKI